MAKKLSSDNIVQLFGDRADEIPEMPLEMASEATTERVGSPAVGINLGGVPKVVMAFGAGNSGKSTLFRWMCERAIIRNDGSQFLLSTLDVQSPTLQRFFPHANVPPTAAGAMAWLERVLLQVIPNGQTALIDFGAGMSLVPVLSQVPNLHEIASKRGTEFVAFYLLTPRQEDLVLLNAMEKAGFTPTATCLVLNLGTTGTADPEGEFAAIRRHSVYRSAVARGALEVWMPKLTATAPAAVENRVIGFQQAAANEGLASPLNIFDQSRVEVWLKLMEECFRPVLSWCV